jgi:hypothetical protein
MKQSLELNASVPLLNFIKLEQKIPAKQNYYLHIVYLIISDNQQQNSY